jgi:hypothetical protein
MYERLTHEIWSPAQLGAESYQVTITLTGPWDYDDSSYCLTLEEGEGPRGERLDWGDCTDTDQGGWPDWAHDSICRLVEDYLHRLTYNL